MAGLPGLSPIPAIVSPASSPHTPAVLPATSPLLLLAPTDVKARIRSARRNQYIELHQRLPADPNVSPAPRGNEERPPIYLCHGASPIADVLLRVKEQWALPVDPGHAVKIRGCYYLMHSCPEQITDTVPLNKVKPELLGDFAERIRRLYLFRYLLGFNLSATQMYCRGEQTVHGPVITGVYSGNESRPFGLLPKGAGVLAEVPQRKSLLFPETILKVWFAQQKPSEVLRIWWRMEPGMEAEKIDRLFRWFLELCQGKEAYQCLPRLVWTRAWQLLSQY